MGRHKIFRRLRKTVSLIRQKLALLIPNVNFDDPRSARSQQLSAPIGRFCKFTPVPVTRPVGTNTVSQRNDKFEEIS
jgi:hypothetical protein